MQLINLLFFFGICYLLWLVQVHEGLKKALGIAAAWLFSTAFLFVAGESFTWPDSYLINGAALLFAAWSLSRYLYCRKKGYVI